MIQIKQFYAHNELRNYSYLLFDDQTGKAWAIDPYDAQPFIDYIRKKRLDLQGILNTHQHFDHIRGNLPLQETFSCPIKKLVNAETILLDAEHELETLDTPGHTLDHQVFIIKKQLIPWALFSGDTLFNAGVGNCKNGGNPDTLFETTNKLIASLPDSTLLYPGHDYAQRNLEFARKLEPDNSEISHQFLKIHDIPAERRHPETLKIEKLVNPFLRLSSKDLRQQVLGKRISLEDEGHLERNLFKQIRTLRDSW